jgi:hypothetical protein
VVFGVDVLEEVGTLGLFLSTGTKRRRRSSRASLTAKHGRPCWPLTNGVTALLAFVVVAENEGADTRFSNANAESSWSHHAAKNSPREIMYLVALGRHRKRRNDLFVQLGHRPSLHEVTGVTRGPKEIQVNRSVKGYRDMRPEDREFMGDTGRNADLAGDSGNPSILTRLEGLWAELSLWL